MVGNLFIRVNWGISTTKNICKIVLIDGEFVSNIEIQMPLIYGKFEFRFLVFIDNGWVGEEDM